jgi:hypothetical protein
MCQVYVGDKRRGGRASIFTEKDISNAGLDAVMTVSKNILQRLDDFFPIFDNKHKLDRYQFVVADCKRRGYQVFCLSFLPFTVYHTINVLIATNDDFNNKLYILALRYTVELAEVHSDKCGCVL